MPITVIDSGQNGQNFEPMLSETNSLDRMSSLTASNDAMTSATPNTATSTRFFLPDDHRIVAAIDTIPIAASIHNTKRARSPIHARSVTLARPVNTVTAYNTLSRPPAIINCT